MGTTEGVEVEAWHVFGLKSNLKMQLINWVCNLSTEKDAKKIFLNNLMRCFTGWDALRIQHTDPSKMHASCNISLALTDKTKAELDQIVKSVSEWTHTSTDSLVILKKTNKWRICIPLKDFTNFFLKNISQPTLQSPHGVYSLLARIQESWNGLLTTLQGKKFTARLGFS